MDLSTARETTNCSAAREIPSILWNPNALYHIHKSSPPVPILSQTNPVHTTSSYLPKIHLNISHHLHLGPSSGLFPPGFPTNSLYTFLSSIPATNPANLILLDLSWHDLKGTNHKAPPYAVFSTIPSLHPSSVKIFPSAPCSLTPSLYVPPLMSETKSHTHAEPQAKI
jgi:hypothetical protein